MNKMPGGKPTNQSSPSGIRHGSGAGGYPRPPKAPKQPTKGLKAGNPNYYKHAGGKMPKGTGGNPNRSHNPGSHGGMKGNPSY